MTDQDKHNLARELREAEALENGLTRLFGSLQVPFAAEQRLLAKLDAVIAETPFHESQLTLDDAGPYSFEQAAKDQAYEGSDLLAAGLETEPEEGPVDEDEDDEEE